MADNQDPRVVARELKNGANIKDAMQAGGYSPKTAKRGRASLSPAILDAIAREGLELAQIGAKLDKEHVENVIAGTLYTNMLTGESKGNEAAKMLGSMVRYEAFKSDANQNLIVLADIRKEQLAPDTVLTQSEPTLLKPADVE